MATFIYKSTINGPQPFHVADDGGIVRLNGRELTEYGGYLVAEIKQSPLLADATSLESAARSWWKKRNQRLAVMGHKANGIVP